MKFISVIASFVALATASKNGSPLCYYDDQTMQKGMGNPSALGYTVNVTQSAGTYNFQLINTDPNAVYQGILLFVTTPGGTDSHLGSFSGYNTTLYKNVAASTCSNDGVSGAAAATLTHSNPNNKASGTVFKWTPNSGDFANGNLSLTAVVAAYTPQKSSGKPTWQHLADTVVPQ
ncbi:hypothetical protein HDV01_000404 [Terramyces sp. JEL0728]|nr:hypothetical protein HDV01_000404 [Terramyces sp. JEL0728]